MARFEYTDPQGKTTVIEAATEDEAWQKATQLQPIRYPSASRKEAIAAAASEEPGNPLAIGAGRLLDTSAMGLKQAALEGARRIVPEGSMRERLKQELAALAEEQAANTEAYKAYANRFPVETAIGESAPYAALQGGPLHLGLQMGALEGLRYGSPGERSARGLLSAGQGFVAGSIGNAVSRYLNPPLTSTQHAALQEGSKMGIEPRLSQVLRSPAIARIEDTAARVPGGAGVFEEFNRANQMAVNRAAAGAMGATPDASGQLSDEVFAATKQKLGSVFDAIKSVGKVNIGGRSVNPIQLDQGVIGAANDVIKTQNKLGSRANQAVLKLAQDAKRMAGLRARIDGEAYQLWHSDLTDASYTAFKGGESTAGRAYLGLMNALDDAAERSLHRANLGGLANELKAVRPLYSNFKLLTKGSVTEGGNVSPARVAQALRTSNPDAFRTGGGGDLAKIGRYAEAFPPLRAGSQTFERTMLSDPVSAAVYGLPAYGAAKIATSPAATFIPSHLGGTRAGAMLGPMGSYLSKTGVLSLFKRLLEPQTP